MPERDLSGLRALTEELTGQVAKLRSGMADMQKEVGAVTATAKSPDGHVTATVGPRGQLVKLQLDPRVYRTPDSAKLAATIVETVQKAAVEALRTVEAVVAKYAPGVDVRPFVRGDTVAQMNQFDFVQDQIVGAGD